ncbi:MAG: T9SS C-terminal target domain-containing protein, partial [Bacteroidota bacterium]
ISDDFDQGVANIEGITATDRTEFGGGMNPIDDDNSGVLRYVSIRFGGAELSPDNEINGLTLGGVGSGTTLEFIEVVSNDDDGIEFFGGTVDLKFGVVAFCADDSYDTDNSWSGRGQFWFSIQSDEDTGNSNPNGGEHDGTESPNDDTGGPVQRVFNATYIGRGANANIAGDNNGLTIKSNCAIEYTNSIFTGFDDFAISMQDGSADRYVNDEYDLSNNIWFGFGTGTTLEDVIQLEDNNGATQAQVISELANDGNSIEDPSLNSISYDTDGMLDPRPNPSSPARFGAASPDDDFFTTTSYRGAFSPATNWADGWTFLSEAGYFGDQSTPGQTIVITDNDLMGNTNYQWTANNTYQLDGFVYLEEGGCLEIEAGTRIEGLGVSTNMDEQATLIITRGAQIKAVGTEDAPIVFTLEGGDDDADIIQDRGAWGGLIILGRASISDDFDQGVANIEGITATDRTEFGGGMNPIDDDNSGILRYVSIRYGGVELSPDNEINGLTLGGV